ncbi:hypothetical protein G6O69_11495 [Pseudenhygromyxa sp. WMMC2535]|uniref:choice-of-anchor L domain-containing protein n=1 Tax=Pseudenhygromyxa sp. WMMC2535 TaxID=2712867 RepID=UPI001553A58F|nr:choice-of-anchor L domain-containing protein [Pseudenhygromyxa sp. WMMC2535]NVB38457.1 hypothetical protein [Pseudenhygromyxa sp. WMMC2535]
MMLACSPRRNALTSLSSLAALALALAGCSDDGTAASSEDGISSVDAGNDVDESQPTEDGDSATDDEGGTTVGGTTTTSGEEDEGDTQISDPKFDVASMPDSPDICLVPDHIPCDHLDYANEEAEAWGALGLNCPGEFSADVEYNGHYLALYVQEGQIGTHSPATYPVREGEKMVVLSTGDAFDVISPGNGDGDTTLSGNDPGYLPSPMQDDEVSDTETCEDNPDLVGTGDCSNTIFDQFSGTNGAFDYAEMRFSITVPTAVNAFAYNVAFLSWEYPDFYGWAYNDIYIAWLESEDWTGNITFDLQGNPLSLNAGFLDYKDAPNDIDCPLPCDAPELEGTGLEGHGGTQWLETTWPVTSGEEITVIFAVMDIQDNIVDSAVLLDNFRWTCFGGTKGTVVG